ncbi:MerR family transcriptional regulator [Parvibacter caecicola]|uniref:DNA-binding transcriptional MerR regulator n=1 Tax=Parvibacter caecicola TaxID=747645 RepID=A0A3N0ABJ8_9ACTN|nr:MerR family transcriptional regulator [Parvibacter caecicola]MBB3170931.1 DNA-binding transcriptional MerR regulator [Parvibacter caecicola]MCR2042330.1 MerR family transcriptional regulator [Parvibacter caecicola]RNL11123.1 MerR family transcriptional regulator [Parvibacter caecicola]TJW09804.1 MerR family transcriptional regulator [Parvibacter caecicola]
MKIAEVSKRYGISADTLRYYERIGILRDVPRNPSGLRDYSEKNCNAVEFVKCMRGAGMSIESLKLYMDLFYEGDHTKGQRKKLLEAQRDTIRARISELEEAFTRLSYRIDHYEETSSAERELMA